MLLELVVCLIYLHLEDIDATRGIDSIRALVELCYFHTPMTAEVRVETELTIFRLIYLFRH